MAYDNGFSFDDNDWLMSGQVVTFFVLNRSHLPQNRLESKLRYFVLVKIYVSQIGFKHVLEAIRFTYQRRLCYLCVLSICYLR